MADDVIPAVTVGTLQGASVGVTVLAGGEWCLVGCGGTSGPLYEVEAGLGGGKAALGVGVGDRNEGPLLFALKVAAFRSWKQGILNPADAVYVGPECDVAAPFGLTLGIFRRVDAPGWRFSVGIVRAF